MRRLLSLLLLALLASPPAAAAERRFPPGFLWGTATAAHQVEGGNQNSDWWRWEERPGAIANGDRSGAASDHWNRYPEDLDRAVALGQNAYRFSVEWARIEPQPGVYDEAALAHYREVTEACRTRGLEPMVTLFHFTLPQWLADLGGFEDPGAVARFEAYTRKVAAALGDQVQLWCTVNEPVVYLAAGYLAGVFPPGKQDPDAAARTMANLVRAHGRAYRALHEVDPDARVGVAKHLRVFTPARGLDPRDQIATWKVRRLFNQTFLDALATGRATIEVPGAAPIKIKDPDLAGSMDFVGLNYYSRDMVRYDPEAPGTVRFEVKAGSPTTDMGWEIYPEGFYQLLTWVRRYRLPVYVTENGLADASDARRARFLRDHLYWMWRALAARVDVRGYFHWSLLDNFEWAEGFGPRFGLVAVDYPTQGRQVRDSAAFYAWVASHNQLPPSPAALR